MSAIEEYYNLKLLIEPTEEEEKEKDFQIRRFKVLAEWTEQELSELSEWCKNHGTR